MRTLLLYATSVILSTALVASALPAGRVGVQDQRATAPIELQSPLAAVNVHSSHPNTIELDIKIWNSLNFPISTSRCGKDRHLCAFSFWFEQPTTYGSWTKVDSVSDVILGDGPVTGKREYGRQAFSEEYLRFTPSIFAITSNKLRVVIVGEIATSNAPRRVQLYSDTFEIQKHNPN